VFQAKANRLLGKSFAYSEVDVKMEENNEVYHAGK
jgi:hypothetical protein